MCSVANDFVGAVIADLFVGGRQNDFVLAGSVPVEALASIGCFDGQKNAFGDCEFDFGLV